MQRPEAATLLHAWERGVAQGPTMRGLLLLALANPAAAASELAATGIGERDSRLLELRESLFGTDLECVACCPHCNERIEVGFPVRGIRARHHSGQEPLRCGARGYAVEFRLPTSADLLAVECAADGVTAERELLGRCLIRAVAGNGKPCGPADLPVPVIEAIDRCMSETDAQAQVELDLVCPQCAQPARSVFDIATHLWSELEAWARATLRDVHALASGYGWSESQVLALSTARRRAYLQLLEGGA